jgi:hypothetical protein
LLVKARKQPPASRQAMAGSWNRCALIGAQ